jgi:hypothetical protein
MATAIMQGETMTGSEAIEQLQEVHERNLSALTGRVRAIKAAKVDAVADTRALKAIAIASGDNHPAQVVLAAPGDLKVQIGEVAHDQFAQLFKIDKRYYDRMAEGAAPLLAQNLNWWLQQTPSERLLRMLKPDGLDEAERGHMASVGAQLRLRGVLGKGYRTIDDADFIDSLLPTLIESGATLQEFSIDERRMHAAFYTQNRTIEQIQQAYATKAGVTLAELQAAHGHIRVGGRDIAMVNEVMAAGVVIRHSEVGFASIGASFVTKVLKCLNRMVADNSIAIRHVGGKNGSADEDVRFISDSTQLMENAALLGRVSDAVRKELAEPNVVEKMTKMLVAGNVEIKRPEEQPLFEFVGNLGMNLGMTQTETEKLKEETVKSISEEGGEIKFAFVQGITAVAREMTDYDRRLEFEKSGFAILNDDAGALLKLGRDADRKRFVK